MSFIVIKTNPNGRRYRYEYTAYRNALGQPRQRTKCLGPIDPPPPVTKRKKKLGRGTAITLPNIVVGLAQFAILGGLGRLKERKYPKVGHQPSPRPRSIANHDLRELYAKYSIDDTDLEKRDATFDRLPKEMRDEVLAAQRAITQTYHAAMAADRPTPAPTDRQRAHATAFKEWQANQKSRFAWEGNTFENREAAQKHLGGLVESLNKETHYHHEYGPGRDDHTMTTRDYSAGEKLERAQHATTFQASLDRLNAETAKSTPTAEAPTEDSSAGEEGSGEGESDAT